MEKKYIVVSPYLSGLGNVLMSLEISYAMAYITGRTLIIPPSVYMVFINEGFSRDTFPKYWDIFDRTVVSSEFDIIDYYEFEEFKPHYDELPKFAWSENLPIIFDSVFNKIDYPTDRPEGNLFANGDICFVCGLEKYKNDEDFINFAGNRFIVDLNREEKYIHFDSNLYQNFYYYVYPGDKNERNKLKDKVNKAISYKSRFFDLAKKAIETINCEYNATHLRRNDFFVQFGFALKTVETSEKYYDVCSELFESDKPLYVSSDEKDRSFFDKLKEKYKIYFAEDVFSDLNLLETAIVEQIICSEADKFIGTSPSTYSKRINILRGLKGKSIYPKMGINEQMNIVGFDSALPWVTTDFKRWEWNMSPHPQWMKE